MLRPGLHGPLWIQALVLTFFLFDQLRGVFGLNLGHFPKWLKLLYVRVLSFQFGFPDQGAAPDRSLAMNRRARRSLARRLRLGYGNARLGWYGIPRMAGAATISGSRSGLLWKNNPGGLPVIIDGGHFSGNVFFVDGSAPSAQRGTTSGFGLHPDSPLSTIDAAYGSGIAQANQGDAIFVLPGHTETITNTTRITTDVAGVAVIGLGRGRQRPTVTFATDATADWEIDSASTLIQNLRFVVDVASLAAPIDVDAADVILEDCDFYGNNAATEAPDITIITDTNANDLVVRRCNFNYLAALDGTAITATPTECIRLVGADRAIIEDCYISGDFTTSAINGITTASLDIRILRNHIHNVATENIAGVIDLVAGCNGVIAKNHGFIGYATSLAAVIDPASCAMIENYFSNVVTEAGGLVGTAST